MSYLPLVAWRTVVRDVYMADSTTYEVTVARENPNDPGALTESVQVGYYLRDYVGHTYTVSAISVGGDTHRIRVTDDLLCGIGPANDFMAFVYQSVGGGSAPYIGPVQYRVLDQSAIDYARPIELDILWKNLVHLDQTVPQIIIDTLHIDGDVDITFGHTYKINGDDLTYSDVGAAAASHAHGNITSDGKIGSTSGLPVVTGASGVVTVGVTQAPQALTQSTSTLVWDIANGYNARVTLTASITTFTWSTAATAGDCGVLTVIQDGTGGWAMVLPSGHLKEGGALTLSTAAGAKDVLGWYYDGTNYFWVIGKAFA